MMSAGAKVIIGVDGNSNIAVQVIGHEEGFVHLLGGIEYAKVLLIDRIRKTKGDLSWGQVDGVSHPPVVEHPSDLSDEKQNEYPSEQKVSRDKAIEATEYAIEAMKMRVQKMKESPDTAEFAINPSLLSQL